MPDPTVVGVNMRCFRMARAIGKCAPFGSRMSFLSWMSLWASFIMITYFLMSLVACGRRTMCGNVGLNASAPTGLMAATIMLCLCSHRNCVERDDQQCDENTSKFLH